MSFKSLICCYLCLFPLLIGAEETLSLIKPEVVAAGHIGDILARFEKEGFRIAALKMAKLSKEQASQFYSSLKERPFFPELVAYMSSGPLVAIVLEGENAIEKNRRLMGDTDPKNAAPGTLRKLYGKWRGENAVHGSDSPEAAKQEIAFFFKPDEILNRVTHTK